jgi:hypothetical protein
VYFDVFDIYWRMYNRKGSLKQLNLIIREIQHFTYILLVYLRFSSYSDLTGIKTDFPSLHKNIPLSQKTLVQHIICFID